MEVGGEERDEQGNGAAERRELLRKRLTWRYCWNGVGKVRTRRRWEGIGKEERRNGYFNRGVLRDHFLCST